MLKGEKVSIYFVTDCLKNFLLISVSLMHENLKNVLALKEKVKSD